MNILLQRLLPHKYINILAKILADCEIIFIKNFLIKCFVKRYQVNMQEAIESEPLAYKNFNEFFTRKLRTGTRNIEIDYSSILSVADGLIVNYGNVTQNILFNIKGAKLKLDDLLVDRSLLANNTFFMGKFITIYLAPHNYHRVHMPLSATLEKMLYVPGTLFSVNIPTVNKMPNVFTKNERVIAVFNSNIGKIAIILVGAMIVGSIVTSWHGIVNSNINSIVTMWDYSNKNITLEKFQEMGLFKLGSTVIVLFENNKINFSDKVVLNAEIKVGEKIAGI